ncbi:hypothetical protein BWK62_13985 [Flavobacterium oreochromis]|uniref:Uncharacterized protein n=2 Tax=Flavobacterium TaxID=237 RepID=A0A246G7N7_9FLAO|nr:hypothetical protein BWK62_13985 [Flavobacterium oreochromis]POR26112.1 hypothetical protein BWK58_05595 [Flavobacterium columnare]
MAVFTATGIVMVSCDKESIAEEITSNNTKTNSINYKKVDSIILLTTNAAEPGPGDDVVIIKPPKP